MHVQLDTFSSIKPKAAAESLLIDEFQQADDCKFHSGQLQAWYNYLLTKALTQKGTIRTVYLHEDLYWFEWEADVDIVNSPLAKDTTGRFYYTGDGIPKKSNTAMATIGTGAMPIAFYPLSMPTPHVKATATPNPPPVGTGDDRSILYRWTVVSSWGEESYPSPVSTAVDAKNGEQVDLSAMTMEWQAGEIYAAGDSVYEVGDEGGTYLRRCITGGTTGALEPTWNDVVDGDTIDNTVLWRTFENNLEFKWIYRLVVGTQYATYQYVDAIAVSETTYSDELTDAELGETIRSLSVSSGGQAAEDWDPPPDDMGGLTYLSNGIVLGFVGKDLYISEAYRPWAFPIAYRKTFIDDIVSIIGTGSTAIVTTVKNPYLVTGTSPASLTEDRQAESRACVSKRSSVGYGSSGIYASADGLYVMSIESTPERITADKYGVEEWAELCPSTMHATIRDNSYYGFYSSGGVEGGIVVDLLTGNITPLTLYPTAVYTDPKTDKLYYVEAIPMYGFTQLLVAPDARSTQDKSTEYDLTGGAGSVAGIVQPDYPRNLVINLEDSNASITALQLTITGTLANGDTDQTEVFSTIYVGSSDLNEAWAHIDSITIDSVTGADADDAILIGWGKKFGLANEIDATTDIYKINEDEADTGVDDLTISTTYNTVQFESDPDASKDYQVWYTTD